MKEMAIPCSLSLVSCINRHAIIVYGGSISLSRLKEICVLISVELSIFSMNPGRNRSHSSDSSTAIKGITKTAYQELLSGSSSIEKSLVCPYWSFPCLIPGILGCILEGCLLSSCKTIRCQTGLTNTPPEKSPGNAPRTCLESSTVPRNRWGYYKSVPWKVGKPPGSHELLFPHHPYSIDVLGSALA